jgi:signal transduction histidine kinase
LFHEVRNPFNGGKGTIEFVQAALANIKPDRLKEAHAGSGEAMALELRNQVLGVQRDIDDALMNTEHVVEILDNVLDLSKLEANELVLRHDPISLLNVCIETRNILRYMPLKANSAASSSSPASAISD